MISAAYFENRWHTAYPLKECRNRHSLVPTMTIARIRDAADPKTVRQEQNRIFASVAGDCSRPVTRELHGAPVVSDGVRGYFVPKRANMLPTMELYVRCRKCVQCLRKRARLWTARAATEIDQSARTWMATFTLRPSNHYLMTLRASSRLRQSGVDWSDITDQQRINEVRKEIGREITLYFKRLRKNTGAVLRYYLVFESHKSGLPHVHALIHEVFDAKPVRHAQLTSAWKLGHTRFKLSDAGSARYVAKYLTKEAAMRVRASFNYGRSLIGLNSIGNEVNRGTMPAASLSFETGLEPVDYVDKAPTKKFDLSEVQKDDNIQEANPTKVSPLGKTVLEFPRWNTEGTKSQPSESAGLCGHRRREARRMEMEYAYATRGACTSDDAACSSADARSAVKNAVFKRKNKRTEAKLKLQQERYIWLRLENVFDRLKHDADV